MRAQGIGLLIWTGIALLFALTTGGTFPWYLFYFLAGVWLVAAGWAWSIARGLHVAAQVDRATATAGDTVVLTVKVENDSLLPIPRLMVVHGDLLQRWSWSDPLATAPPAADGRKPWQALLDVQARRRDPAGQPGGQGIPDRPRGSRRAGPEGETLTALFEPPSTAAPRQVTPIEFRQMGPLDHWMSRRRVRLERRGRYTLGPVLVEAYDPLGLFCVRRVTYAHPPLTVYPRPLPVPALNVTLRHPFGRQPARARAWQDPSSLSDVRAFRPGDNPKHIHWKLTARLGELHVKEFDLRATTDCFVFLDLHEAVQAGSGLLSTAETAVALAAGLAVEVLQRDLSLAAFAHTERLERLPPGRGSRHVRQAMRWLVELGTGGRVPLADLLASQRDLLTPRSVVVAITPQLTTPLAGQLLQLRQQGHPVVLWLLDRDAFGAPWPDLQPSAASGPPDRDRGHRVWQHSEAGPAGAGRRWPPQAGSASQEAQGAGLRRRPWVGPRPAGPPPGSPPSTGRGAPVAVHDSQEPKNGSGVAGTAAGVTAPAGAFDVPTDRRLRMLAAAGVSVHRLTPAELLPVEPGNATEPGLPRVVSHPGSRQAAWRWRI